MQRICIFLIRYQELSQSNKNYILWSNKTDLGLIKRIKKVSKQVALTLFYVLFKS